MTDEPNISEVPQDADQERWLTYLNYDQSVKQAVRRLGALSVENVDLFRSLLMQGRDRSRVSEYEAESIRRLQGEAFVGDEELQRALIVLHAEDPHLAEEFKRVVAATGKPQELDQTIAAIRAKDAPAQPVKIKLVETVAKSRETPVKETAPAKAPAPVARPAPPPEKLASAPAPSPTRVSALRPAAVQEQQGKQQGWWRSPLAIAAALLLIVGAGLAVVWPKLVPGESGRPAQIAAAPPPPSTNPAPSPPPAAAAPAAETAMPAQNDANKPPEIRAASDAPDKIAPEKMTSDKISPDKQTAPADARPAPVPGSYYKVVRGDMLTDIAVRAYRDASKFLVIQRANPSLRASADRILVDQVIFIPPVR